MSTQTQDKRRSQTMPNKLAHEFFHVEDEKKVELVKKVFATHYKEKYCTRSIFNKKSPY